LGTFEIAPDAKKRPAGGILFPNAPFRERGQSPLSNERGCLLQVESKQDERRAPRV